MPAIGNDFIVDDQGQLAGLADRLPGAPVAGQHGRPPATSSVMQALLIAALVYWVLTIVFSFFQAAPGEANGEG